MTNSDNNVGFNEKAREEAGNKNGIRTLGAMAPHGSANIKRTHRVEKVTHAGPAQAAPACWGATAIHAWSQRFISA